MGPVVCRSQYEKILAYIADGEKEGLTYAYGGAAKQQALRDAEATKDGCFITPTVFVDVPVTSKLWKEEIFGPVLCVRVSS